MEDMKNHDFHPKEIIDKRENAMKEITASILTHIGYICITYGTFRVLDFITNKLTK